MVECILIGLPFLVASAWRLRVRVEGLGFVFVIALSVRLLILSGSSQALVGSAVLILGYAALGLVRYKSFSQLSAPMLLFAAVIGYFVLPSVLAGLNEDEASLSGRTPLFAESVRVILVEPVAGTGASHFDVGVEGPFSAHNALLSIGVIAGIPAMAAWVVIIVAAAVASTRLVSLEQGAALSMLSVLSLQFVATLQTRPLVWFILMVIIASDIASRHVNRDTVQGDAARS
nr:O-antigen ligase family protein [Dietzia cercidiphylli]